MQRSISTKSALIITHGPGGSGFGGCYPISSPTLILFYWYHAGFIAFILNRAAERILAIAPTPLPDIETVTYAAYDIYNGWKVADNAAGALRKALKGCHMSGKTIGLEMEHYLRSICRGYGKRRGIG